MIRLGLCCAFRDQPIKFANTTVAAISRMKRRDALEKLSRLCLANADSLMAALQFCADRGIGCFRVNSQILPVKTHPQVGYAIDDLPHAEQIVRQFRACGDLVRDRGLRTCFHPDQFVVLNSQRPEVITASLREIEYQAEVAQWIGADVINIHAGGAFGDKIAALHSFARSLDRLSDRARGLLTVENDDTIFTPTDLLPLCRAAAIPLVYDVHHHRCLRDAMSIEEATEQALATWNREPMLHISSPQDGWNGKQPKRHHDMIDVADFPDCWRTLTATIEVEARAKEAAVLAFKEALARGQPTQRRKMLSSRRSSQRTNVSPSAIAPDAVDTRRRPR